MSAVLEPSRGSYCISTAVNSRGQEGAPADGEVPRAVLVDDPGGLLLQLLGEPLVEDVGGQRDVVVGGEHLGAGRQARPTGGVSLAVLRRPEPLRRIGERAVPAVMDLPPPRAWRPEYFDIVVFVNAHWSDDDVGHHRRLRDRRIGRRGHGRRAGRRRRRRRRARPREAGPGRRVDVHVRRHLLDPEQPADAGRGRPRLVRGRHGPLRDGGRRRRPVLVVRAAPRVPHRRPGDDHVPPAPRRAASSPAPATATTTPT